MRKFVFEHQPAPPKPSKRKAWAPKEHELFLAGLKLYQREWKSVAAYIGTKTVKQVKDHAYTYFSKVERNGTGEYVPPMKRRKSKRKRKEMEAKQQAEKQKSNYATTNNSPKKLLKPNIYSVTNCKNNNKPKINNISTTTTTTSHTSTNTKESKSIALVQLNNEINHHHQPVGNFNSDPLHPNSLYPTNVTYKHINPSSFNATMISQQQQQQQQQQQHDINSLAKWSICQNNFSPSIEEIQMLSDFSGLSKQQVANWFSSRKIKSTINKLSSECTNELQHNSPNYNMMAPSPPLLDSTKESLLNLPPFSSLHEFPSNYDNNNINCNRVNNDFNKIIEQHHKLLFTWISSNPHRYPSKSEQQYLLKVTGLNAPQLISWIDNARQFKQFHHSSAIMLPNVNNGSPPTTPNTSCAKEAISPRSLSIDFLLN